METKFNFNSSVCTSKEQSESLLALGLKKETADMCYRYVNTVKGEKKYELIVEAAWSQEVTDEYVRFGTKIGLFNNLVHPCGKPVTPLEARADLTKNDIPAWSLHRLLSMLPRYVRKEYIEFVRKYIAALDLTIDEDLCIGYKEGVDEPCEDKIFYANNIYNSLCDCIEWLIKEGYFNKEYLEE